MAVEASMAMIPREQLSRTGLLYVLAAYGACVSLLAFFLPWWLLPVALGSAGWRLLVFAGRVSFPPSWLKVLLVLLSGAGLFAEYGITVSLDVFVMLLLLGFSLKLLELYHRPDARLLLYLAFFVLMTAFLFNQSPLFAVYVFTCVAVVLAALVALHSSEACLQRQWWQPLRRAGIVFAMALPVMLFMFVVMPRLPPLWVMPLQKQQARTGMSDTMSPGDIASLARSSELAFRVTFAGPVPERRELYWYGMLLDSFDGRTWKESCPDCLGQWRSSQSLVPAAAAVRYDVILEPHGGQWLYTLSPSIINERGVWVNVDGIYRYTRAVGQRQSYQARFLAGGQFQSWLGEQTPTDNSRALPAEGNPRARALAQQWRAATADDQAVLQKALDFYHASFHYTLQPPPLGEQRVDDFLFNTRRGFCEHFAGSFVFLMRAAGIPARVAVGYMGGEVNAAERYVVVRQYDAHAWAEVWLAGRGWVRVDPTAAVAPERIELGFADAFAGDEQFALDGGLAAYRHIAWLNNLRLSLDRLDYLWARWVLGYEGDGQRQLLQQLGLSSPWRILLWVGIGTMLMFVLLLLYLLWREYTARQEPHVTRIYRYLCGLAGHCGVSRQPGETPLQFAARAADAGLPASQLFEELSAIYYRWCYTPEPDGQGWPDGFAERARGVFLRWAWLAFRARYRGKR